MRTEVNLALMQSACAGTAGEAGARASVGCVDCKQHRPANQQAAKQVQSWAIFGIAACSQPLLWL